jgi:hypothetical protein
MGVPTFEEFVEFVREFTGLSHKAPIVPSTKFEKDLGVTGDDGVDLLRGVQTRFNVVLCSEERGVRDTFTLGPNEFLFHSEGFFDLMGLFSRRRVRALTVGELYQAVCRASTHDSESQV